VSWNVNRKSFKETAMLCADIMKADVECVSAQSTIRDAAQRMRQRNVGFLPVCDDGMRALGAITDRDIAIRCVAENRAPSDSVETIVTREVIACRPEDDLSYARELMSQHQKSRIMCINRSGRLEGVISLSDIAQLDELAGASTLRQVSAREFRGDSA
jgi:CBS domain-containing protein